MNKCVSPCFVAVLFVLFSVSPFEVAIAEQTLEETGIQLVDVADKLHQMGSLLDYIKELSEAVKNEETPPDMPPQIKGGDTLLAMMQETERKLKELEVPAESSAEAPNFPTAEQILSGDMQKTRAALHQAVENTLGRFGQQKLLAEQIERLAQGISTAEASMDAARKLADAYGSIYEKLPLTEIGKVFGFAWISLEGTFIPKIGEVRSAAEKKHKLFTAAYEKRAAGLKNLVANLKAGLDLEQKSLTNAQAKVKKLRSEFDKAQQESKAYVQDIKAANARDDTAANKALTQKLNETKKRAFDLKDQLDLLGNPTAASAQNTKDWTLLNQAI